MDHKDMRIEELERINNELIEEIKQLKEIISDKDVMIEDLNWELDNILRM